jgi:hypothetical protein
MRTWLGVLVFALVGAVGFAQDYPGAWSRYTSFAGSNWESLSIRERVNYYNDYSEAYVWEVEIRNRYDRPVRVSVALTPDCDIEPEGGWGDWQRGTVPAGGTEDFGGSINWHMEDSPPGSSICVWSRNVEFK